MTRRTDRNLQSVQTLTPLAAHGEPRECELQAFRLRAERGSTYKQIGERFNVTESAVRQWCEKVERWYLNGARQKIDGIRYRMEARYDYIYRMAHGAYRTSRNPGKSTTTMESADGKNGKPTDTTTETVTEHADGNPAWLRIMLECTNRVADLYGACAPRQPEGSGNLHVNAKVALILANADPSVLDGIAALAQSAELPALIDVTPQGNEPATDAGE